MVVKVYDKVVVRMYDPQTDSFQIAHIDHLRSYTAKPPELSKDRLAEIFARIHPIDP